jgi:hypothetical protein
VDQDPHPVALPRVILIPASPEECAVIGAGLVAIAEFYHRGTFGEHSHEVMRNMEPIITHIGIERIRDLAHRIGRLVRTP